MERRKRYLNEHRTPPYQLLQPMNRDQFKFVQDVAVLILYIWEQGWRVTFGEAWRPQEMQDLYLETGKTTVSYSRHQVRQAIDLNFFKPDGGEFTLTYKKEELQKFGDKWESIDEKNQWGGNWVSFVDTDHFERGK